MVKCHCVYSFTRLHSFTSSAVDEGAKEAWLPTAEEKALLKDEFVTQMHQRFLDGEDKEFDYRSVRRRLTPVERSPPGA